MAIHSAKNLYPGVNAHLNSFLQAAGSGWESFHSDYITLLRMALDRALPAGYLALSESSLQVSEIRLFEDRTVRTQPDIMIFENQSRERTTPAGVAAAPTATLELTPTLELDEETISAVIIYQWAAGALAGRPVTRVELLSPANKPPHSYHQRYLERRAQTIGGGVNLVEIDYLHQQRPVLQTLPSYRDHDAGAYPYLLLVSDPHPSLSEGRLKVYGFGVDDPIPQIAIPLAAGDQVIVDFGAVYHQVVESWRLAAQAVDYAVEPLNMAHYHPPDQARIRARMAAIAAAQ